jgi:hypothetical protein
LLLVAVLGIVAVGCGSPAKKGSEPVYPVSGVITRGGRPVAGADVTFYNAEKNRSAFGRTNDQGAYKLTTFSSNDGAVEGSHVVTILKLAVAAERAPVADLESEAYMPPSFGESTEPAAPKSELPERYAGQGTSGLTATIRTDGPNEINFDLE